MNTPTKTAADAASWALSKKGCEYSQPRRLQEKVFDCSSLVARAYIAQGVKWYYGGPVPLSMQEVYSDEFELLWPGDYSEIGKKYGGRDEIAEANHPGDIQFLCTDSSTTRPNRITHVAMVVSSAGIVHARGKAYGVCVSGINHYAGKVCAVTRYNPSCTLRSGMKGYRTLALQKKLNDMGCSLAEDGEYGAKTMEAVKTYQKAAGLIVTGQANEKMLSALALLPATEQDTKTAPAKGNDDADGRLIITGDCVNIRSGPGTDYPIIKVAHRDETYDVCPAWYPVLIDGKICWASAKYSRIID